VKIQSTAEAKNGLVAILDALGAANFGDAEIQRFITARAQVLGLLADKAENVLSDLADTTLDTFTFNDTILVTCSSGSTAPTLSQISAFLLIIRKFLVDSLANKILFRGSISIGKFYSNDDTNTVLGDAVSDAAAWYNQAAWIGVHCTPKCSLTIDAILQKEDATRGHILVDHSIPLRDGRVVPAKAVNWPKIFLKAHLNPWKSDEKPKAKLLELLSQHAIPLGIENKYHNTILFFDRCMELEKDKQRDAQASATKRRRRRR
jgi:hypothetical protein